MTGVDLLKMIKKMKILTDIPVTFEGKFERPVKDWPKPKSQKDNVKPIKAFFGRKM